MLALLVVSGELAASSRMACIWFCDMLCLPNDRPTLPFLEMPFPPSLAAPFKLVPLAELGIRACTLVEVDVYDDGGPDEFDMRR